jgi:hypothetical protein
MQLKPAAVSWAVLLVAMLGAVASRVPASTFGDFPPLQPAGELRESVLILSGKCTGDCRVSFPQDDPTGLNRRQTQLDPLDPESGATVEIHALRPAALRIESTPVTGNALGAPEPGTLLFVAVGLTSLIFLRKQARQ